MPFFIYNSDALLVDNPPILVWYLGPRSGQSHVPPFERWLRCILVKGGYPWAVGRVKRREIGTVSGSVSPMREGRKVDPSSGR